MAKALFSFEARDTDELTINEGDVVEIVKKIDDGWWEVSS